MATDNDNPPVGILLCTQKDHTLVEYALASMDNHLFVNKYQLELPKKEKMQRFLEKQMKKVAVSSEFRYTQKKVAGKYIELEFEGWRRGYYGRLLTYVFVDGKNINLDLIRKGLSPYYTKYGRSQKYDAEFRTAEKRARNEKLHIWGNPELTKKYLRLKSKWSQRLSQDRKP